ncbi:hypothetical protein TNCV_3381691 [Trichonephila clavipes]|nr:hypothetical protein TNCV_3381691 [Trichonephila clavipes]
MIAQEAPYLIASVGLGSSAQELFQSKNTHQQRFHKTQSRSKIRTSMVEVVGWSKTGIKKTAISTFIYLTDQWDRDEILAPYGRLFHREYGLNFILLDDNARRHRTQLVDECLQSEDIK